MTNNLEGMKKLIEKKQKQSSEQGNVSTKPNKKKVSSRKAFKISNGGGFFDK
ncbi:hypothetical protein [Alkalibaculum bacchi]|uniref:hypothetical protein n=1 Tax=Alkalibaculum bacchi TaxID=645887 RepID=UPI0026F2B815|nr:hypothetical protein [Alkalibaculum bacchi]